MPQKTQNDYTRDQLSPGDRNTYQQPTEKTSQIERKEMKIVLDQSIHLEEKVGNDNQVILFERERSPESKGRKAGAG